MQRPNTDPLKVWCSLALFDHGKGEVDIIYTLSVKLKHHLYIYIYYIRIFIWRWLSLFGEFLHRHQPNMNFYMENLYGSVNFYLFAQYRNSVDYIYGSCRLSLFLPLNTEECPRLHPDE